MPPAVAPWAESGAAFAALLLAATAALAALFFAWRRRNDPAERERRRRLGVHRQGRATSGLVLDIAEQEAIAGQPPARLIHYTYKLGAVEYSACQDVSALPAEVGQDPSRIVGPAQVMYRKDNPYDSIVVCERWSGLRRGLDGGDSVQ